MLSRVVLAVLITLLGLSLQIYARHRLMRNGKHGALGLPKINPWQRRFLSRLTTPQWFNQKLDHFNPQNTDTWKQVLEIVLSNYFIRIN